MSLFCFVQFSVPSVNSEKEELGFKSLTESCINYTLGFNSLSGRFERLEGATLTSSVFAQVAQICIKAQV